jgi:hypothetical protein
MKVSKISRTFFLISFLFLTGCTVLNKYEINSTPIDLSKFDKQGIFVTTGDLFRKYKSLSILDVNCYDGFIPKAEYQNKSEIESKKKQPIDGIYETTSNKTENIKNFRYKSCTLEDLFAEIISQAKTSGANGIIKLEIRNITKEGLSPKSMQRGLEIVGLAIKIEE